MDGSTLAAAVTVGTVATILWMVSNRPPPEHRRETRAVPIGYVGTRKWQQKYPSGARVSYHPSQSEWQPDGIDVHQGHHGQI